MIKYILKRILLLIPVVIAVAIIIFTIMYFVPGDPADIILGSTATDAQRTELYEQLGLDQPYIVQLGQYLYDTFIKFDLGSSGINKTPVLDELLSRLPNTLIFALSSMVIQIIIGIPLGIYAATHHNKAGDYICMFIALAGVAIPSFWLALLLMLLFGVNLGWLPVKGVDSWTGWILPIFCGALSPMAQMARQTRSSMLEVIRADYVDTAKAKGMSRNTVIYKYAFPNGLIPVVQTLGNAFGTSLGGTLIIETVFSIPGVGLYLQQGITNRDRPIVQGSVVLLSILFSIVMLLVDIAFAFIDPRIKAQYTSKNSHRRKRAKYNRDNDHHDHHNHHGKEVQNESGHAFEPAGSGNNGG